MRSPDNSTRPLQSLTRRQVLQFAGAAAIAPSTVLAQNIYPSAPVRLVVSLPPGGVVDVLARGFGERFRKESGQPIVIENVPGAAGVLGAARVARARPDGYTVGLIVSSAIATSIYTHKNMGFDPDKDLLPVAIATQTIDALVVHRSLPVNTLQEYIAYAKARPGVLAYGTPGVGSPHHFAGEFLSALTGIKLNHIPYKGATEAASEVTAGHVPSAIAALGLVMEQAKAGAVRILALTDDQRTPNAPEIPTIGETVRGFAHSPAPWTGLFVPAQTPKNVIAMLNGALNASLREPEFAKRLNDLFLFPVGGAPEAVAEKVRYEREVARKLVDRLQLG